jgi:hypothetical protein
MKYAIIEADNREEFEKEVMENLEHGWILCSGFAVDNGMFYQPIRHGSDGATKSDDGFLKSLGVECGICGKVGCTKKLHSDIADIVPLIKGLKNK